MDLVYIGKLVNTHGLKGEVRIISDFEYKGDVFQINNSLYINNKEYKINSYRHHKIYEMVIFDGVYNIEDAVRIRTGERGDDAL